MFKKFICVLILAAFLSSTVLIAEETKTEQAVAPAKSPENMGAAFLSCLFGAGTGEWLSLKSQSFGQCCIEHLFQLIPFFGIVPWIGSIIDSYKEVKKPQANLLFTTVDL